MKRVYHLLPEKWALGNLKKRRIKVTRFNEMNDPFELLGVELSRPEERQRFGRWRRSASAKFGLLCFSRNWANPVLWSHYADRHRGLCLGFDVPTSELHEVKYLKERWQLTNLLPEKVQPGPLFCVKFRDWEYEDEWRRIITLAEAREENERHFWPFGPDLVLREVIAGPRCKVTKNILKATLGEGLKQVEVTKARLAFHTFRVVPNKQGWSNRRSRERTPINGR